MGETWKQFVISALRENILGWKVGFGTFTRSNAEKENDRKLCCSCYAEIHIIEVSFEIVLGLVIKIKPKKQVKLLSTLWISIVNQDESTWLGLKERALCSQESGVQWLTIKPDADMHGYVYKFLLHVSLAQRDET